MFRLLQLTGISLVVLLVGMIVADRLPDDLNSDLSDRIERISAKNFDYPPDAFRSAPRDEVIGEMGRRGFKLKCYGSLRSEEKIGPNDDYMCWSIVKSAYNDIPAQITVLGFSKGRLTSVKLDFPASSYEPLQRYLSSRLEKYERLKSADKDIYGSPLITWMTNEGMVITSAQPTPGHPLTVLWSRYVQ